MASRQTSKPNKVVKPVRDIMVKVDAKLKAKWDSLLETLNKAKGEGAEAFDAMYEAAGDIVDHKPPLYVVGGFANAAEFFLAKLGGYKNWNEIPALSLAKGETKKVELHLLAVRRLFVLMKTAPGVQPAGDGQGKMGWVTKPVPGVHGQGGGWGGIDCGSVSTVAR
jgi:hypothetical protein